VAVKKVRVNPGPVARLVTKSGRRTDANGKMQIGVILGPLERFARIDDSLIFGNPLPPHIIELIPIARELHHDKSA